MADKKEHFDEDFDLRVYDRFSAELKALFKPKVSVPGEIDRAVLDRAAQRLVRRRRHRILRWAGAAAAVAAVITVVLILNVIYVQGPGAGRLRAPAIQPAKETLAETAKRAVRKSITAGLEGTGRRAGVSVSVAARADIDKSGRVDILDAFILARYIESPRQVDIKWDINGDGLVNRDDVDSIAYTAVRLDTRVGGS